MHNDYDELSELRKKRNDAASKGEGLRIPSRFKLFAETVEVVEDPGLLSKHHWCGSADFTQSKINLVPVSDTYPATSVRREQTFLHEVVHHIADAINLELSEKDTDLFGRALHQVLTTMEYDD